MDAETDKKLRFSDVVFAIDTTPKALRNWLQRDQVKLFSKRAADGGWQSFSLVDVAVLALVRKLVDFGIGVKTASKMAHEAIKNFPDHVKKFPIGLPLAFLNRLWIAWPEKDGERWELRLIDKWKGEEDLKKRLGAANAYIVLDIENILRIAFDRAKESLNEGATE